MTRPVYAQLKSVQHSAQGVPDIWLRCSLACALRSVRPVCIRGFSMSCLDLVLVDVDFRDYSSNTSVGT